MRHFGVLVDNLCHVGRSFKHAVYLLDIAVLTGNITLDDLLAVYPGLVHIVGLMVGQYVQVCTRHLIVLHEGGQEMDHRGGGVIPQDGDASAFVLEFGPHFCIGHLTGFHDLHGVINTGCRLTAHGTTLLRVVVLTLRSTV